MGEGKYWKAEEGRRCRVCGRGGGGVVETCTGQVCGWRRGGKGGRGMDKRNTGSGWWWREMDGGFGRKKSGVGEVECKRRNGVNETETEVGGWRLRGGDRRNRSGERASERVERGRE